MAKINITELSIEDLMEYEKAAKIICTNYEKSIAAWGADTFRSDYEGTNEFQEGYKKYKAIYDSIISEIEKRLSNLK